MYLFQQLQLKIFEDVYFSVSVFFYYLFFLSFSRLSLSIYSLFNSVAHSARKELKQNDFMLMLLAQSNIFD